MYIIVFFQIYIDIYKLLHCITVNHAFKASRNNKDMYCRVNGAADYNFYFESITAQNNFRV